jgi:uncharacterized protein with HEPN domain
VRLCLPFEDPIEPLSDILEHIGDISEAAIRPGPKADEFCPGVPWRDIRGIGNRLRRAYDMLDFALIWKVYQDDLPPLKAGVAAALKRLVNPAEQPPAG